MTIEVVRIGQRLVRDDRVTTHAALVSRAFGASRIYMNETNSEILQVIDGMNKSWGGSFEVTMYGYALHDYLKFNTVPEKILIVIGASKVPREIYSMADYNVSVGLQPHSEIAALAVFLDRIQCGEQFKREFPGASKRIIPSRTGKCVSDL